MAKVCMKLNRVPGPYSSGGSDPLISSRKPLPLARDPIYTTARDDSQGNFGMLVRGELGPSILLR